jgi:hypothetical protein
LENPSAVFIFEQTNNMRKPLILLVLCLLTVVGHTQEMWYYTMTFDDTTGFSHLTIDSADHPGNSWQIGMPQKTVFNTAFSPQHAMVTDTLNPYPVNDTAYFVVNNPAGTGWSFHDAVAISGQYWVDSDSISDHGTMELSLDNGSTWINLINDPVYASHILWESPVPVLTGRSGGWQSFFVNVHGLRDVFGVDDNDPVLWRFGFISDGIDNVRDGLMYDNLGFYDYAESVPEYGRHDLIAVFPNPVAGELRVKRSSANGAAQIRVYNAAGETAMENSAFTGEKLDVHNLENGIYLLRFTSGNQYQVQRFVVQR